MKTSALDRVFNTIRRAVDEFGMAIDTNDALIDIFAEAEDLLLDKIDYDRIDEGEMSNHHSNLVWEDGKGYLYSGTGEFIGSRTDENRWFRKNGNDFDEIQWIYADEENDYVLAERLIDSDGNVVAVVSK